MRALPILAIFLALNSRAAAPGLKENLSAVVDARTGAKIFSSAPAPQAILFVGYLNGCPLFAKYQNTLKKLNTEFGDKLLIVNFDPDQSRGKLKERIRALDKLENKFPLVLDPEGRLNEALGISVASEAAILDTKDYKLIYRGAIDDSRTIDFERPKAEHEYAREAVASVISGKHEPLKFTTASGCALNIKAAKK